MNQDKQRIGRGGFTLVELMVVIAVILVLLGIGAGVGSMVDEMGSKSLTETTLQNLASISAEQKALTGKPVSLNPANENWTSRPYNALGRTSTARGSLAIAGARIDDIQSNYIALSIEMFVSKTYENGELRKHYGAMDEDTLQDVGDIITIPTDNHQTATRTYDLPDGNDFLEVRDGWGSKIVYVFDAPLINGVNPSGFVDKKPGGYFVSAGSDKKFGSVRPATGTDMDNHRKTNSFKSSQDNLYSTNQ